MSDRKDYGRREYERKCGCGCISKCKSCAYSDPQKVPPLEYDYWNETWWLNWNTTNGWGATKGETQQGLSTGDNLSGYGLTGGNGYGYVLPQGKKLKMVYEYKGRFYVNPGQLIFVDGRWVPVSEIPGVKKSCRVVTV